MTPRARKLLLLNNGAGGGLAASATLYIDSTRSAYYLNGVRYSSLLSIPGISYTGGAPNGVYEANADGTLTLWANNVPREPRGVGYSAWASAQNLPLWSQAQDNAAWVKTSATVSADVVAAPDATLTADKLVEAAATSNHLTAQTVTVVSATQYTISVYAKAAERSFVAVFEGALGQGKFFNLATGAVGGNLVAAPTSASIQALANGWYRCSITVTTASTVATPSVYLSADGSTISYLGNGASGAYLWGAQLELGSTPTPYIPTTGAAATRAADVASIANFTFPVTGTVLADYVMPVQPTPSRAYLHFVTEASNSRFAARGADASNPQPSFVAGDGTTVSSLQPYAATTGQLVKTAMAYDTTSAQFGAAANGVDGTTARQVTASILINATFLIGSAGGGGGQLNSYVKRLVVLPTFYSSAQRTAATT